MLSSEEIYVRQGLNDLGTVIADAGLTQITDTAVLVLFDTIITLSHTPSTKFIPQIMYNGSLITGDYSVTGTTLSGGWNAGTYLITYWY